MKDKIHLEKPVKAQDPTYTHQKHYSIPGSGKIAWLPPMVRSSAQLSILNKLSEKSAIAEIAFVSIFPYRHSHLP